MIKGYNNSIGFSDLHPARFNLISVPLKGAKFLTGMKLIMAHLADSITAPSPIYLFLKEKNLVN